MRKAVRALGLLLLAGCACRPEAVLKFDPAAKIWLPQGSPDGDEYKRGNTFGMEVSWSGPGEAARIEVRLDASRNPGSSTNSGGDTLPDAYFEQELNPGWSLAADETSKIAGIQVSVVQILLPAGGRARLVVSCFDWAADFRVKASVLRDP